MTGTHLQPDTRRWMVAPYSGRFTPMKDPVPVYSGPWVRSGWHGKSHLTRIQSLGCPDYSELLYQLCHPGHHKSESVIEIKAGQNAIQFQKVLTHIHITYIIVQQITVNYTNFTELSENVHPNDSPERLKHVRTAIKRTHSHVCGIFFLFTMKQNI